MTRPENVDDFDITGFKSSSLFGRSPPNCVQIKGKVEFLLSKLNDRS